MRLLHRTIAPLLLAATPAAADIRADADALITQSFQDHRILFNCSERTPDLLTLFENWMPTAIEDARPQLTEIGYTDAQIETLKTAGNFHDMLLPDDATLGELRALCDENPDWQRDMQFMNMVILSRDLQTLIDAQ